MATKNAAACIRPRHAGRSVESALDVITSKVSPGSGRRLSVLLSTRSFGPALFWLAERDNIGRLISWLLRVRTVRAIVSDVSVSPDVARATVSSVTTTLLRGEQRPG
jgi:hypothetical protein